jgi:nucleotide-binding universal stress UspA family protein
MRMARLPGERADSIVEDRMSESLKTILAAVDFSRGSEAAARRAAHLAKACQSRLEILYVLSSPFVAETWELVKLGLRLEPADLRAEADRHLREMAARIELETGVVPETRIAEGRPYEQIAARAADAGAGLVVVGAHGQHALLDVFVGATAQKVLRASPVPVLMVRQTPYFSYERVLVAIDFSVQSKGAARLARRLFPNAELCLMHAYESPLDTMPGPKSIPDETIEAYRHRAESGARVALERFAQETALQDPDISLKTAYGHASSCLLEFARAWSADLIVAGARGLSGWQANLLGSVSLHLVLESRVDVLLVRLPQDESAGAAGAAPGPGRAR